MKTNYLELIQKAYNDMPDQELIKIKIENEEKNNISQEAVNILENELNKREINIKGIKEILGKTDIEFYKLFISNQNFAISNGSSYLINELNKRLKKYSNQFKYETSYLISQIKSHKTGIENLSEEKYLALISHLKISNISEKNEQILDKILKSTAEELLNSTAEELLNSNNNNRSSEENGIIFNLHKAGNDIKKIGKYLTRYFVGQLLFTLGYLLQFRVYGKPPSPLLLMLNGIAVIIIIIMIIEVFYDAGNALLRIKDDVKSN